jgi:hypothetical protein
MPYEQMRLPLFIIGATLVSGLGDSMGFIYAARMWRNGDLIMSELGKSALGFSIGIGSYWVAAKYLSDFGILAPETQTVVWFGITIAGVAFASGRFLQWQTIDQVIAAVVVLGIAWLLFRAG